MTFIKMFLFLLLKLISWNFCKVVDYQATFKANFISDLPDAFKLIETVDNT